MQLDNYRLIFIAVGLIGVLLFSLPAIGLFIKPPTGESFSELYLLGPNHNFDDIPFNIKTGVTYKVYIGVGNQREFSSYYTVVLKFRNATEPLPNATIATPSPLPLVFEYKSFVQVGETWEVPLTFQIKTSTITNDVSYLPTLIINGLSYPVNKASAWDSNKSGYYYGLFAELWTFNSPSAVSEYDNRSVNFLFNMTA